MTVLGWAPQHLLALLRGAFPPMPTHTGYTFATIFISYFASVGVGKMKFVVVDATGCKLKLILSNCIGGLSFLGSKWVINITSGMRLPDGYFLVKHGLLCVLLIFGNARNIAWKQYGNTDYALLLVAKDVFLDLSGSLIRIAIYLLLCIYHGDFSLCNAQVYWFSSRT